LVDFVVFCYIFGMLYQEKSGNPDRQSLTHQLEFKKTETRCTSWSPFSVCNIKLQPTELDSILEDQGQSYDRELQLQGCSCKSSDRRIWSWST
jgi:hypothetical protein